MPKVIVREIDNTKAVGATYSNFTVVIPGPVSSDKFDSVADENHVYECSSISEFETNIGKYKGQEEEPAVEAEPAEVREWEANSHYYSDVKQYLDTGHHFATKLNDTATEIGYLVDEHLNQYKLIDNADLYNQKGAYWIENSSGKLVNNSTIYLLDNEGVNAKAATERIVSNRLAYLLVSLGYTILFKATSDSKGDEYNPKKEAFWNPLIDKANYDFRYIALGDYNSNEAINEALKVAARWNEATQAAWPTTEVTRTAEDSEGRGDVTVLVDVNESDLILTSKTQSAAIKAIQDWVSSESTYFKKDSCDLGKYAAIFAPKTTIRIQKDADYGDEDAEVDLEIPASIYYLACAAKALDTYAEWYAVAGYQRGISDWTIVGTSLPLGDLAVQKLEPRVAWVKDSKDCRSVNIVTRIRTLNNQFYLWGERTAHPLDGEGLVASHFLNIRQLCTTLKKDIYNACKKLTFSPNDELLWIDFKDLIRPTLENMKADRGIKDYDIKRITVSEKALMKAKIRIVPIEPVEDFNIGVYLEDSIAGVTADVEEE